MSMQEKPQPFYTKDEAQLRVWDSNIPQTLKDLPNWVHFKLELQRGKWTKVPYTPGTNRKAKINDETTWSTFHHCLLTFNPDKHDGIMFALTKASGIVSVDADDCRDWATGEVTSVAKNIINTLGETYADISPFGEGLHWFIYGQLPEGRRHNRELGVEIYDDRHFMTITGHRINACTTIADRSSEILELHRLIFPPKPTPTFTPNANAPTLEDNELLNRAFGNPKNGDAIRNLYNGAWQGAYGSQSEADGALCFHLAYYTSDPNQIERILLSSGLCREKLLQRHDYRHNTINNALSMVIRKYQPPYNRSRSVSPSVSISTADNGTGDTDLSMKKKRRTENRELTDLGNAERLIDLFGDDIKYCNVWKKWIVWNGKRWQVDDTNAVERYAHDTIRNIHIEAAECDDTDRRVSLAKHAYKSESNRALSGMVEIAKAKCAVSPDLFDADTFLLNVENGTLDLRTGVLHQHSRNDLITKNAGTAYEPDADCPVFDAFLQRIMGGDPKLISYLSRLMGYALTGDTREQTMWMFYGSGANGKSTLLSAMSKVLNDYSKQAAPETLLARKNRSNTNDLADLRGARLATAIETDEGRRLAESLVKQLTGNDIIKCRYLFQEYFEYVPQFKLILATNHRPEIKDTSPGMWRRIKLVPFSVTIPESQWDRQLDKKLEQELPGILAWCVRGCLDWQHNGMQHPDRVSAATNSYQSEQDALQEFINECCIVDDAVEVRVKALYDAFKKWAEDGGETVWSKKTFGIKMNEKGCFPSGTTGANIAVRRGINLKLN